MDQSPFVVGRVIETIEQLDTAAFSALSSASSLLEQDDPEVQVLVGELWLLANRIRGLTGTSKVIEVSARSIGFGDGVELTAGGRVRQRLEEAAVQIEVDA